MRKGRIRARRLRLRLRLPQRLQLRLPLLPLLLLLLLLRLRVLPTSSKSPTLGTNRLDTPRLMRTRTEETHRVVYARYR